MRKQEETRQSEEAARKAEFQALQAENEVVSGTFKFYQFWCLNKVRCDELPTANQKKKTEHAGSQFFSIASSNGKQLH